VVELLTLLAASYDHVVIDTPNRMSARLLAALDLSDHHVLVTAPSYPALKSLRVVLDVLDVVRRPGNARSIVLNHADAAGALLDAEIESLLRAPVEVHLPSSADVLGSINNRVPIASSDPDHPTVVALRAFAETRLSLPREPATIPSARTFGRRP
jgi:MinD-like ATPase involved in chromosome partitioning or flagellar assembly